MRSQLAISSSGLTPLQSLIAKRWQPSWICASCRPHHSERRYITTKSGKPYYITTPIFYVNAAPHIGHMYTMVLADVMKRWQVLKNRPAVLCTGTDEHGLKIQQAAVKADRDPQSFCDSGAEVFKQLALRANISFDYFVRTTDQSHKEAVEYAWTVLEERGYIFRSKHEGWYSISDEAFYPDSAVHIILDPRTGHKKMVSKETNNEVQWSSESNYHFRLSAFRDRLLEFYEANPEWITPAHRMRDVVAAVEEGLQDLSISRPYDRLKWAIRVPTDSSQSIYVWLDALLNYASKAGYPWPPGSKHQNWWPADVHVIGKDIVRFHCIYWPAFLMALDLPLPKRIMTHAHWTMENQKMSKSIGNVVNPFWAVDRFGVDTMRFFLIHHGGLEDDSNYDNAHIVGRYQTDLQFRLGNLASRLMNNKMHDMRIGVERYGGNPEILEQDCKECQIEMPKNLKEHNRVNWQMTKYRKMLLALPHAVDDHMRKMEPNKAVQLLMTTTYAANAFLQNQAPWDIFKTLTQGSNEDDAELLKRRLHCTMFLMAETLRLVGIMLQPFMPEKSGILLDMLLVEKDQRSFKDAQLCGDRKYGRTASPDKAGLLFPALANVT
ncbi:hypothetical protein K461DRAFT_220169 [Myriangium duriaei CBS 260.36]|uniref:Probable methionine--tRNA ligase, mitochondrial n=1 Tax=Myriangium duriaei CBS 260.36 TaxID=1168546 RepID=A0A9P4J7Q9_9PEZI|nr:hypothetical protein K461DRAFT_220169 [Myriangium duriaei CBS 260.36]